MKRPSTPRLLLNQKIKLDGTLFSVIGVDKYQLNNLLGKIKTWTSYTLIDEQNNKTWISYGIAGTHFIQWEILSEKILKQEDNLTPLLDYSGIASITFEGNYGYSTPAAELIWFSVKNKFYSFVVIERFLEKKKEVISVLDSYYLTGKILKNLSV
jgi:hypothetical protein